MSVGAGDYGRARRIAWTGAAISAGFTALVGLTAAASPTLWIGLFSRRPEIVETGSLYLRIVGPSYVANGLIFALNFAAQGSGRMLWPFLAGGVRLLIAAGGGWVAVAAFGCSPAVLFAIVASASVVAALVFVAADLSGSIWRRNT
jgi:Na+-driven multidrug efflux pump